MLKIKLTLLRHFLDSFVQLLRLVILRQLLLLRLLVALVAGWHLGIIQNDRFQTIL